MRWERWRWRRWRGMWRRAGGLGSSFHLLNTKRGWTALREPVGGKAGRGLWLLVLRHGLIFILVLVFIFRFVLGVVVFDEAGDTEADELIDGERREAQALCFRDERSVDVEYLELDELVDGDVGELLFGGLGELRGYVLYAELNQLVGRD